MKNFDWDELMFDYPDKIDRPWHEYSKRPKLTFYRYKKAEKMSCEDKK